MNGPDDPVGLLRWYQAAKVRYFGDLLAGNRRQGPHRWELGDVDLRRWWIVGDVVHE